MKKMFSNKWVLSALSVSFALAGSVASATTINVNSLADNVFVNGAGATFSDAALTVPITSASCTLRMAIAAANLDQAVGGCAAGAGADTVSFVAPATSGTITLSQGSMSEAPANFGANPVTWLLIISTPVTIAGPGSAALTINGGAGVSGTINRRSLLVNNGDDAVDVPAVISGVTLKEGRLAGDSTDGGAGGCLFSSETISLTDVVFENCETVSSGTASVTGGAFSSGISGPTTNPRPNVTLNNTRFIGNRTVRGNDLPAGTINLAGAAAIGTPSLYVGNVSISGSRFSGNVSDQIGALRIRNAVSASINESEFRSNTATNGNEGGFSLQFIDQNVAISDTAVVANSATLFGGGFRILNVGGNVTISGGGVGGNYAGSAQGGFTIQTVSGNVSVSEMLVFGNIAQNDNVGGFDIATAATACSVAASRRPVTLTNVTVRGNLASTTAGGFRLRCNSTVNMSGMSVESNEVQGSDTAGISSGQGAALVVNNDSVSMTNSVISGNKTFANTLDPANFGGFQNFLLTGNDSVNLNGVTVKGNWVARNEGGISVSLGAPGRTATIENSSFYDNLAQSLTALFMNGEGSFTVRNTTIAGNSSTTIVGGGATGINANSAGGPINLTLENVTIARNGSLDSAFGNGGFGAGSPNLNLTIKNTILGANRFGVGAAALFNGGAGYNYNIQNSIFESAPGAPAGICGANGVLCDVDAKLESLTNNGGATQTLALRPGSPALDAGAATTLTTDQRGASFPRVLNGAVDIGAYESPVLTAALPCKLDFDNDSQVTATKEGIILLRAILGFSGANVIAGTPITQLQWDNARSNLNANCGTNFAP